MSWFSDLFGFGNKQNYSVKASTGKDNTIRGLFRYKCIVSCPTIKTDLYTEVEVHDAKTIPVWKCKCGRKVSLYQAPIVTTRNIFGKVHSYRAGESTRIDNGDGHSVRLGETLHYEIFEHK